MNKAKVYLSGGIAGLSQAEASAWRNLFKDLYGHEWCLDPMRQAYKYDVINNGHVISDGVALKIVEDDLRDIREADALVVYYREPSVGTSMEMVYAKGWGRHIITINASGKPIDHLSPWLRFHSNRIVPTLQAAVSYAEQVCPPSAFNPLDHEQTK